ncbi:MAG: hypothetical protein NC927_00060, partial [Candidatus Omnitrophica bacterium]|nr:hypothetical protein [Candidatus Omnitrophota bacterium]
KIKVKNMNILLFERSLEIKFQIARYIEQLCTGCNLTTLNNIPSTIQEILKGNFEIIIIDIDFTGKQLNELLKVIKDTSPKSILIVLTFYPDENVKNKLQDLSQELSNLTVKENIDNGVSKDNR